MGHAAAMPAARGRYPDAPASGLSQIEPVAAIVAVGRSPRPPPRVAPVPAVATRPARSLELRSTRRAQRWLNSRNAVPMRVPPDQSPTAALMRSSASSGSRCRSWGVMRVRRVPKQNASVGTSVRDRAWQNRSSSRACRSIEPQMSHSRTTPRGRVTRRRHSHATGSPPVREVAAHHLARRQQRAASMQLPAARPAHRHPEHHPVDEPLGLPQLRGASCGRRPGSAAARRRSRRSPTACVSSLVASPDSTLWASRTMPVVDRRWRPRPATPSRAAACGSIVGAVAGQLRQSPGRDAAAAPEPVERLLVGVDLVACGGRTARRPPRGPPPGRRCPPGRARARSRAPRRGRRSGPARLSSRPKPRTLRQERRARDDGGGTEPRRRAVSAIHRPGPPRGTPPPARPARRARPPGT